MKSSCTNAETLVGEILHQRYAVLEAVGPDQYDIFDTKRLCRMRVLMQPEGSFVVLKPEGRASAPPPIPAEALQSAGAPVAGVPSSRARIPTRPLETAWFARGESLAAEELHEVVDYVAYQEHLEQSVAERAPDAVPGEAWLRWAVPVTG